MLSISIVILFPLSFVLILPAPVFLRATRKIGIWQANVAIEGLYLEVSWMLTYVVLAVYFVVIYLFQRPNSGVSKKWAPESTFQFPPLSADASRLLLYLHIAAEVPLVVRSV